MRFHAVAAGLRPARLLGLLAALTLGGLGFRAGDAQAQGPQTPEALAELVGPIALYPDDLVAAIEGHDFGVTDRFLWPMMLGSLNDDRDRLLFMFHFCFLSFPSACRTEVAGTRI